MTEVGMPRPASVVDLGLRPPRTTPHPVSESRTAALERFRQLIDCAADLVLLVDLADDRIVDAGERVCSALGFSREQLLGRTLGEIDAESLDHPLQMFALQPPDDPAAVPRSRSDLVVTRLVGRNGREIPVELSIQVARLGDRAYGILIGRDLARPPRQAADPLHNRFELEQCIEERTRALRQEITERKYMEAALLDSEQRFRDIAVSASDWFWETDAEQRFTYVSERFFEATRVARVRVIGRTRHELVGEPELNRFPEKWRQHFAALDQRLPFRNLEYGIVSDDGSVLYIRISGQPVFDQTGLFQGYRGAGTDITVQRRAEEALRLAHDDLERRVAERTRELQNEIAERNRAEETLRLLSAAVHQSPASVYITDAAGRIQYVNPRFVEITGYAPEEAMGEKPSLFNSGYTPRETYSQLWRTILSGSEWRSELLNKRKNGELFWQQLCISPIRSSGGQISHFVAVAEDISVRKYYERRLLHEANHDRLTGLPNRLLATDRLTQAVASAQRTGRTALLLLIGLDQFKRINETLGHAAGDCLLIETARRIAELAPETDTVARLAGDEFMLLGADLGTTAHPETQAQRLLEALAAPCQLSGQEMFLTASVGIALYPDDGDDPQVLMRNAEAALFKAKECGGNTYRFFTPEMNRIANQRLTLENGLRHALRRGELSLAYQAVIDSQTRELVGAEALLRWHSPTLGHVPPDRFIPMAEETGLITAIDTWVLHTACREAAAWQSGRKRPVTISVNVSPRMFRGAGLIEATTRALNAAGLPATCLSLEITERLFAGDTPETVELMRELVRLGVGFAIDDFGTGYSSLSYLKRFPVSTLKIDRSFVQDVTVNASDAALVKAILAMAHSLGLTVVGEGVETWSQLDFLKTQGCDRIQGYYYGRPLPAAEFRKFAAAAGPVPPA
ncbi:MAG: EAL domain-containing protein [Azospirillum sp.]|nr:EAL domain-containing protein [Azospirillum sp.]